MALNVKTGTTHAPLRVILQGQEGVGKTTWAAACPAALFLTCEDGGGILDYARAVLPTWQELRDAVWSIQRDGLPGYRTLVIDTIDSYERLLWQHIADQSNVDTIEEVGGGFGKGYTRAAEQMGAFQRDLDTLRQRHGLNIILLAHVHVRPFNDPTGPAYDRYEMRLHKGTAALWSSWADCVLFACFDATVLKAGKKGRVAAADAMEKGKATEVRRVVYTSKEAAFDAKNRHGLPDELPLTWDVFARAIRWDAHVAPAVVHAPDGEGHHPSFTDDARAAFMARLGDLGIEYAAVKAFCKAKNRQKPSAMDLDARAKLLDYLSSPAGRAAFTTGSK